VSNYRHPLQNQAALLAAIVLLLLTRRLNLIPVANFLSPILARWFVLPTVRATGDDVDFFGSQFSGCHYFLQT